jgi:xylan 1,4-beta-xylosidase
MTRLRIALLTAAGALACLAQERAAVRVDLDDSLGRVKPVWAFFGHDEPNYAYMRDGLKLNSELAALSPVPVHVRVHNLLTSGDGTAALKWGSTNAYTEDAQGRSVYDWTIVDRIFDTWLQRGMKPLVEIGFMPEALTTGPAPYRHSWDPSVKGSSIYTGWAYPPRDYGKWGALVEAWVRHCVDKYGREEVESWWWEVWNEPDISYWKGTPEEYFRLYEVAARAAKKVLPSLRMGGPTTTGPANEKAAEFLRDFLGYVDRNNVPLDYVSFHAKGRPTFPAGHVRMGPEKQMADVARGFEIVTSFPKFRKLPVIIGESDPEGCAACGARWNPQNAYRNGTMYSSYTAATFARKHDLAAKYGVNFEGAVTWAFEFENQPWFEGFRDLATNGVDKPVLNVFRMFGLMGFDRVRTVSDKAGDGDDINGYATRSPRGAEVMVWNYHNDDVSGPDAAVTVPIRGIPAGVSRVLLRHYRVDRDHSNSYSVWIGMGSPQNPSASQVAQLERAGELGTVESPRWMPVRDGEVRIDFVLPRQGVSLLQLSW